MAINPVEIRTGYFRMKQEKYIYVYWWGKILNRSRNKLIILMAVPK
jgi:hypothetical protein